MFDLLIATAVMATLAFAAYAAGLWVTLKCSPRAAGAAAVVVALVSAFFALTLRGRLCLALLFPTSAAAVLTDLLPIGAGYLAGVVAADQRLTPARKVLVAAPITLLAWISIIQCFFTGIQLDEHPWSQFGFPIQSNDVSCSPTAGAELLRAAGIAATEREMIDLCLTQSSGTTSLGLYRGLKLKTAGTDLRVEPLFITAEQVKELGEPLLVFVHTSEPWEREESPLSLLPPAGDHSIIVYGYHPNGEVDIGDPALGRLPWPADRFARSFSGEAIRLRDLKDADAR